MNPNPASLFNYASPRAAKARLAVKLGGKSTLFLLRLGAAFFLLSGVSMVLLAGSAAGWLLCIPGILCFMLLAWYVAELRELPPGKTGDVHDVLEVSLLGRLPRDPSSKDIARAMLDSRDGYFFAARFAIDVKSFAQDANTQPGSGTDVWLQADHLRQAAGLTQINSPCVAAALLFLLPGADRYLAQLRLDDQDILQGIKWHKHILEVIAYHKQRPLYGGIARDWAFGFTPLLERFGYNVTQRIQNAGLLARNLEGHQDVISQTYKMLTQSARRNAVLVGGVGSGRTTIVHMLAEELIDPHAGVPGPLRYNQVIALDPATLISQASGRGELEQLVHQLFIEALTAKNIVLFLDDAQLFLQDGTGSVDLSNILLPVLEGGALRLVMAMDEQRWLQLAQSNPNLTQLMNRVVVTPLGRDETMLVMEDQLLMTEHQARATYQYQALREAYNLSERYVQDQVMPGRALKLMESAANFAQNGIITAQSVQQAIEKTYNIKVGTANNADERETLLNLEQLIHQRMINQTRAVQVVSDALRRARAGVRNPNRPIGTFLFLGPTGVGKTELAKSLAAAYFGGEDRLIRIDLNEYVRSEDLIRLIADGATDPHSLSAQIAKQPFSVVLLDEIEKAHPDVLSALLQLLDEGILRDANNRQVSFRDAIVVATSNAGSQQIRAHIERGEQIEQFEQQLTDELINSNQFRPEFLNRFDEIVLFRPLTQDELMQVVDLIISSINKTLQAQKVSITLTEPAKRVLVQQGYDPRLGARPLRRVVQRTVENVMAQRMLTGQIQAGDQVTLDVADITGQPAAQPLASTQASVPEQPPEPPQLPPTQPQ